MEGKVGRAHHARKALFQRGIRLGHLTVEEIETALPDGLLTPSERWLLYYSLRAAHIEIVGLGGPLERGEGAEPEEGSSASEGRELR